MKKSSLSLFFLALALILPGAATARAGDVKFPANTDPAFAFTLPDGWESKDDGKTMTLHSSGKFFAITLTMINNAEIVKMTLDDIHKAFFGGGHFVDSGASERVTFAGKKGEAFPGTHPPTAEHPTQANVRLTVVKLDETHAALFCVISKPDMSDADKAELDKMTAAFRFTAAK